MTRRLAAALVLILGSTGLVLAQTGQAARAQDDPPRIYKPGPEAGVTWPKVVESVPPSYTEAAMRAEIQGTVILEAVVLPSGRVGAVEVVKSLDRQFGLDDQAIAAARRWEFEPAVLQGTTTPVATRVTLELEFRLHDVESRDLPRSTGARSLPASLQLGASQQMSLEEFERGAWREDAPGVNAPRIQRDARPRYTSDAMRAKIQGIAVVDAVVDPDGTVARVRLVESVDPIHGLDAEALAAARRWRFEPGSGTLDGRPVPVIVRLKLEFRIH